MCSTGSRWVRFTSVPLRGRCCSIPRSRSFCCPVARKGMWCRLWARELLESLLLDGMVDLGFEPRDYLRQTDLQVAGVGWLAQHNLFHRIAKHYGAERIATLDSETLTRDPAASVARVAAHFGLRSRDAPIMPVIRRSPGTANPVRASSGVSGSWIRPALAKPSATKSTR